MISIRASSLNMMKHCPGSSKLLATTQRSDDTARILNAGTIAHAFLENKYKGTTYNVPDDLQAFELEDFWDWWVEQDEFSKMEKIETEKEIKLQIDDECELTGHIDLSGEIKFGIPFILDWKYGSGQAHILKPLEQDLQLRAYGLMKARKTGTSVVNIYRVLVSDKHVDEIIMDIVGLDAVEHEIRNIFAVVKMLGEDTRIASWWCEHCLARRNCPEYQAGCEKVTGTLIPHEGKEIVLSRDQATRWALARGAVADRVDMLNDALKKYIESGGIVEADGKILKMNTYETDIITNQREVIDLLVEEIGSAANSAISTSKTAVTNALKATGRDKKGVEFFLNECRQRGAIKKGQRSQMRWASEK